MNRAWVRPHHKAAARLCAACAVLAMIADNWERRADYVRFYAVRESRWRAMSVAYSRAVARAERLVGRAGVVATRHWSGELAAYAVLEWLAWRAWMVPAAAIMDTFGVCRPQPGSLELMALEQARIDASGSRGSGRDAGML